MTWQSLRSAIYLVLAAGILSPIISVNWQEWVKVSGNDQMFVRYLDPAMEAMAKVTLSNPFIVFAILFAGVAAMGVGRHLYVRLGSVVAQPAGRLER